ncbi:hypothetical protein OU789_01415 [Halocynthiibacter sp. C4]|uniref:hypothetical protein n=1 Tax=Halocynthiibacter sp. C4 TaxID=2992758 RepID=UPI00237B3B7E|nr:hypothetical protein [Halocynthiibacter sp. C4]MDE0588577.1 hypothetical protein [Halocynthiibacter sp. C4]
MSKSHRKTNSEHWTKMVRNTMEEPAWQALSPVAQALYPWLKFEWHGPRNNNNGKINFSVRQAAQRLGVSVNTASRGFHDLQRKGFIVITEIGTLGHSGFAKSPKYELTEITLPYGQQPAGRKLYKQWRKGNDFPVQKSRANNPHGANGKRKILSQSEDNDVIKLNTRSKCASS